MTTDIAYHVVEPRGPFVPLVLDSPHSGTEYPEDFRAAVPLEALRQAEDSFVDELYGGGPLVGATLVAARFPRSYIDPNRSLLDIDATLLEGRWRDTRQVDDHVAREASGITAAFVAWHLDRNLRSLAHVER